MMTEHQSKLLGERSIHFHIAGAGGNGSIMLTHLCRIHQAWSQLGGAPFKVIIYDDDTVSESNLGRQCFCAADLGCYKAAVLAQRASTFFGLDVEWHAYRLTAQRVVNERHAGLVYINCTDTASSRVAMAAKTRKEWNVVDCPFYWLDLGNLADTGQVILGGHGLPHVVDVLPQIKQVKERDAPSCSMAEALSKQDLFINSTVAGYAGQLLWQLLRKGVLTHHGYFINLASGHVRPLPVPHPSCQK